MTGGGDVARGSMPPVNHSADRYASLVATGSGGFLLGEY